MDKKNLLNTLVVILITTMLSIAFSACSNNDDEIPEIIIDSNHFEIPVEGDAIRINVKANMYYEVSIPHEYEKWLYQSYYQNQVQEVGGAFSVSTYFFIIDKNEEYDKREGQIIFKGKNKEVIVTICQAGEGMITLSQKEYNVSSSAQELVIEIKSNFDYALELPDVDWLRDMTDQTRATSTHTLRLAIAENETYDGRSAKIRVFDKNSSISEEIVINQSQKNALIIDTNEFEFDEKGGSFEVEINSNLDYKVSINCDWITETTTTTRALTATSHSFAVSAITDNSDREGTITFSDTITGINEQVIVKQSRAIYFDTNTLTMLEGSEKKINLTNKTTQEVTLSSSNVSVVSVDNTGTIEALNKGIAIITATTSDGLHVCECEVIVKDITGFISAASLGGSGVNVNGLIQYGSKINWRFSNNSPEKVHLKTMQLIDGVTGSAGNQMSVDDDVAANSYLTYSVTIGLLGIYEPVTCRFRYEHNGTEYYVDAVYRSRY